MTKRVYVVAGLVALALAGCEGSTSDLDQWMAEQKQTVKPARIQVTPPATFVPFIYDAQTLPDPFSSQKLMVAQGKTNAGPGPGDALFAAEQKRERGPLEAIPLDTMAMVGSLERAGHKVALIKAGDLLYQVSVGSYLGLDYGRVMSISETEVQLRELIQDGDGAWTVRPTTLHLQQGGSNAKQ